MVTTKKSLHEVLTTPSEVLKLIKHGADVNAIVSKSSGDTALHVAASQGLLDAAQLLLDHGANFNIQNVDNWVMFKVHLFHRYCESVYHIDKLQSDDVRRLCMWQLEMVKKTLYGCFCLVELP
eukprot:TRINITY_DN1047_c0_g1_i4.p1 TRINITY_DN1047_c0_g1~~TRINITY_DN1047_c0_g1_i4.p1  ORF type:complete len:123 (-),score=14.08 TRINITY_DN1047_c0_g1_i4:604-972(-)